jgi:HlyD family secretion protein
VEAARSGLKRAREYPAQQTDELRRIAADAPLPTVAEGQLNVARSELSASRAALEKLILRAPIDGSVLQVNARPGELISPSAATPLVLLGDISALRVRAEVDERDIEKISRDKLCRCIPPGFAGAKSPARSPSLPRRWRPDAIAPRASVT